MHVAAFLFATGLVSTPVTAGGVDDDLVDGPRGTFEFLDGGMVRVVERGLARGTDRAPVAGVFRDPASGRSASVLVGASVIVRLAPGASVDALAALDVKATRVLSRRLSMWLVESTRPEGAAEDAAELAARLSGLVGAGVVDEAYPDLAFRHRLHAVNVPPNDPRYGGQFYLDEIVIEDAWAITTGSPDVSVLVADNGCDLAHPDLVDKMDTGFDPFDGDDDPSYEEGQGNEHGTACAGIIAASTDNNRDIAGTCPECRLRCARLLPADGELVNVSSDVLTFDFALETDVDIVSNSWGFVDAIPVPAPLRDAIIDVQQNGRGGKGAVVVFASGNDSRLISDDELLAVPGVLGVGAVNNFGELTQFSNGGNSVDVVAPTGSVTTDISGPGGSDPGDVTVLFGGTSSACPVVAGVAGLVLAHRPDITADDVNAAIEGTAKQSVFATPDDDGHDDYYGWGLLQPAAALAFFDEEAPPPGTPPPPEGCACSSNENAKSPFPGLLALVFVVGMMRLRVRRP